MADDASDSGLTEIYQRHRAEVLRFLVARTGNAAEAEDIVQELWIKTRAVPSGPVGNGRAYLFRMAQNLVLDRARERKRREHRDKAWSELETGVVPAATDVADTGRNALEQMEDREEAARLISAIATVPEGARRVFQLHKVDELSHAEVAARLNISKSAVEKHMAVAMKYLRRALMD